jgi:deazaflavin-dependent oxidoreductase (nitroreductase family)
VRRPLSRKERIGLSLHRGLDRWLSPLGVWVMRLTRGAVAGPFKVDALVLTTRGRRSGRERSVVLQFLPDGDSMIVVAANDGGASHPGWYHNLTATPEARVEVRGRAIPVHADRLPTDEAATWWRRIVEASPDYERYERAARRTFPILRLVPASSPRHIVRSSSSDRDGGQQDGRDGPLGWSWPDARLRGQATE